MSQVWGMDIYVTKPDYLFQTRRVARDGMGETGMSLKTLLLGDTDLASVRRAKLRTERELAVAKAAVVDAQTAYEVALEEGADDEAMRAVVDKQHVAGWQVNRLAKKLTAASAQIATLEAQARGAQLKKHLSEVLNKALEHGKVAKAASASYWASVAARTAMFEAGFSRELDSVEMPPLFVADTTSQFSADPASHAHDHLDRWVWNMEQLKRKLEVES